MLCFELEWILEGDIRRTQNANQYFLHHIGAGGGKDCKAELRGDVGPRIAVDHDAARLLLVKRSGTVLRHDPAGGKFERMLRRDEIVTPGNVRFIGEHFYVAGFARRVLRRDGVDQWSDITEQLRTDLLARERLRWGFSDVDGVAEDDIYAVGGNGDAWRFDAATWHRLDVPTDAHLECVHCAPDGNVYIGGSLHTVTRGRGDRWELLHRAETNQILRQIFDLDGELYAVDDWGRTLYAIDGRGLRPADTGQFRFAEMGCRCVATGHAMLLVAGSESAALYDGRGWRDVFRSGADDVDAG